MTFTETVAMDVLRGNADSAVLDACEAKVAAGTHVWRFDPEVEGVIGLLRVGTNRADMVVYINVGDFELSDEFFEEA